jgi:hypothetical protein
MEEEEDFDRRAKEVPEKVAATKMGEFMGEDETEAIGRRAQGDDGGEENSGIADADEDGGGDGVGEKKSRAFANAKVGGEFGSEQLEGGIGRGRGASAEMGRAGVSAEKTKEAEEDSGGP